MTETLVVEDEILVGMNLKQIIESCGCEDCRVAANAEEARRAVEEAEPEFIIMDIKLAEAKEGLELSEEFKGEYDPTIVACTSYSDSDTLETIRAGPLDGYILKPLTESNINQLLDIVFDSEVSEAPVQLDRGELFAP